MARRWLWLIAERSPEDFAALRLGLFDADGNRSGLVDDAQQLASDRGRRSPLFTKFNVAVAVVNTAPALYDERSNRPRLATAVRISPDDAGTFVDMLDVERTEMTSDIADAHIVAVCPKIYVEGVSPRPPLA